MLFKKKEKPQEEKKYYYIRGYRFTIKNIGIAAQAATAAFYYMIFKALDGDELARECLTPIIASGQIIKDADDVQVYPPLKD